MKLNILCIVSINIQCIWNYAEFDNNARILPNFSLKHRVKIAETIISIHSYSRRNLIWAPFALITIVNLFNSCLIARFNVSWLSWAQQSTSTHFSWSVSQLENWSPNSPDLNSLYYSSWGVATDGVLSQNFRHWSGEMRADEMLGSAKSRHIELTNRSVVKKTDDSYQGEGVPILNLVCTNCACQLPLLLLSLFVRVKNWVKFTCCCQIEHNFKCTEFLCKLCKEYLISLTSQFCTSLQTKYGNFWHITRLPIFNCCKVINSQKQSVFRPTLYSYVTSISIKFTQKTMAKPSITQKSCKYMNSKPMYYSHHRLNSGSECRHLHGSCCTYRQSCHVLVCAAHTALP